MVLCHFSFLNTINLNTLSTVDLLSKPDSAFVLHSLIFLILDVKYDFIVTYKDQLEVKKIQKKVLKNLQKVRPTIDQAHS